MIPLPHKSGSNGNVAELADATDSKSVARKGVWVRVPPFPLKFKENMIMPYIPDNERIELNPSITNMVNSISRNGALSLLDCLGRINYCFTRVIVILIGEVRYSKIAMVTGVLDNVKDEFYRRLGISYEDQKITSEGDIPEYKKWR